MEHRIDSVLQEWDRAGQHSRVVMKTLMDQVGCSQSIHQYVGKMKGYPQVLYLCAGWVEAPDLRFYLGTNFCVHATGLKLLDDIVDADQSITPSDLVVGHLFCDLAVARLSERCAGQLLIRDFDGWASICKHVLAEPDTPITDLNSWIAGCRIKSGKLMALYGEFACRAAQLGDSSNSISRCLETVGIFYQIWDDFRDARLPGEQQSNLAALLRNGRISIVELEELLEQLESQFAFVIKSFPPAFDFRERFSNVVRTTRAWVREEGVCKVARRDDDLELR